MQRSARDPALPHTQTQAAPDRDAGSRVPRRPCSTHAKARRTFLRLIRRSPVRRIFQLRRSILPACGSRSPRPGPQPQKRSIQITQRIEPRSAGIHPTVQRNIRRPTDVFRQAGTEPPETGQTAAPGSSQASAPPPVTKTNRQLNQCAGYRMKNREEERPLPEHTHPLTLLKRPEQGQ
jgi:hypothetical protein